MILAIFIRCNALASALLSQDKAKLKNAASNCRILQQLRFPNKLTGVKDFTG
jgi:hypothetical protein